MTALAAFAAGAMVAIVESPEAALALLEVRT
jgi:hypothetical protein